MNSKTIFRKEHFAVIKKVVIFFVFFIILIFGYGFYIALFEERQAKKLSEGIESEGLKYCYKQILDSKQAKCIMEYMFKTHMDSLPDIYDDAYLKKMREAELFIKILYRKDQEKYQHEMFAAYGFTLNLDGLKFMCENYPDVRPYCVDSIAQTIDNINAYR